MIGDAPGDYYYDDSELRGVAHDQFEFLSDKGEFKYGSAVIRLVRAWLEIETRCYFS